MNELLYAFRQLSRKPRFSFIAVSLLALGIGATTAIYSSFHTILVRPLPVPSADQLVNLRVPGRHLGGTTTTDAGDEEHVFSYPMFRDLESDQTSFSGIAAHASFPANLSQEGRAQAGTGMLVSGSYFNVLNLQPALGRLIGIEDEPRIGESAVAVLSYDYWRNDYGGDPTVVGKIISVNGQSLTIVGVAPQEFVGTTLGTQPEVYVPLTIRELMQPATRGSTESRFSYWLYMFARLKPNVSLEAATTTINVLHCAILAEAEAPLLSGVRRDLLEPYLARRMNLEPGALGQGILRERADLPMMLLLGLTASVLLIVCINIANLLLARGVSRMGEMAVRKSLGARDLVLVRQLFLEASALAVVGGILSIPVASLTLTAIASISPAEISGSLALDLSLGTLLFVIGAVLMTSFLFGLLPAMQAARSNPGQAVNAHHGRSIGSHGMGRVRSILASLQVAFSLVLIVLAGLFAQSLRNVAQIDLGMSTEDVVTFDVAPRLNGYNSVRVMQLADRIEAAIGARPGIESVASSWVRPLIDDYARGPVTIEGVESDPGFDRTTWFNAISPAFFRTLSVRLLAGREFTSADSEQSLPVAIVNEAFVQKFNLGVNAVGERFGGANDKNYEIVGVVEDAKYGSVKGDIPPQYFLPRHQYSDFETLTFYIRGSIEADAIMRMVPRTVSEIDPNLPVYELMTMRRVVENNVYFDRMVTILSSGFAALALLLAGVGLYSVLAYNVVHRTREFGLRQALGARPSDLRWIVFKQMAILAVAGMSAGLAVALALSRIAESLLFGLTGHEPVIYVVSIGVLALFVAISGWIPARNVSRIAPMQALRED